MHSYAWKLMRTETDLLSPELSRVDFSRESNFFRIINFGWKKLQFSRIFKIVYFQVFFGAIWSYFGHFSVLFWSLLSSVQLLLQEVAWINQKLRKLRDTQQFSTLTKGRFSLVFFCEKDKKFWNFLNFFVIFLSLYIAFLLLFCCFSQFLIYLSLVNFSGHILVFLQAHSWTILVIS